MSEYVANANENLKDNCDVLQNTSLALDNTLNRDTIRIISDILLRTEDYPDLMKANDVFLGIIYNQIKDMDDVVLVTNKNSKKILSDIKNCGINHTYIVVISDFDYSTKFRTYKKHLSNGECIELHYTDKQLPSEYSPCVYIFSSNVLSNQKAYELIEKYLDNNSIFLCSMDDGESYLEVNAKVNKSSSFKPKTFYDEEYAAISSFRMNRSPWISDRKERCSVIKDDQMNIYRMLQRAQYYISIKNKFKDIQLEMKLYRAIFEKMGLLSGINQYTISEEYKKLRIALANGNAITIDMIDSAFPTITLFYHDLTNDIYSGIVTEFVGTKIDNILSIYNEETMTICQEVGLPDDVGIDYGNMSSFPTNMCEPKGVEFAMRKLEYDISCSINSIISEYKKAAKKEMIDRQVKIERIKEFNEEYEERRYCEMDDDYNETRSYRERDDDDDYESRGEKTSSFVGNVAAVAIGASIANSGIKKELRKQNEELERQRKEDDRRRRNEELRRHEEGRKERYREAEERKRRREEEKREINKQIEDKRRRWKEEQERLDRVRRRGR